MTRCVIDLGSVFLILLEYDARVLFNNKIRLSNYLIIK